MAVFKGFLTDYGGVFWSNFGHFLVRRFRPGARPGFWTSPGRDGGFPTKLPDYRKFATKSAKSAKKVCKK